MTVDEICSLNVKTVAALDAHLYLWVTLPMMESGYRVVKEWGFEPQTLLTWCKKGVGFGQGWRGNTEHLIVARRGFQWDNPTCAKCKKLARGQGKCECTTSRFTWKGEDVKKRKPFNRSGGGTWYESPRGRHSAKPEMFMDMVQAMSSGPYLEMFARSRRLGWESWGNEVANTVTLPQHNAISPPTPK